MSTRRLWLLLISLVLIPTIALIISFSLVVQKVLFSYLLVSEFAHMFFPVCNALWFLYLRASCPCNFPWEISLKSYVSFKSGSVAPMDPWCVSKIIKQNLWTLKCKYSFFIVILVKTKEKKKLSFYFDDPLRNKVEI